ncbi:50S ribosomal protein L24 [Candidatus Micrarchaeota archaeon]|nr:50S ribosomal protein L24 [Candidatus Micrarchaeota archaeon]
MKSDTERKIRYNAKIHKKKDFLHVHLSKDLRQKLKTKKRSLLVHKGDKVKIMRGFARDKTGKVADVNYNKVKVYVEGVTKRTARGKEVLTALEPSNLLLLETEMTKERKELFKQEAVSSRQDAVGSKPEVLTQKQDVVSSHEKVKVEHAKVVESKS